MWCCCGCAALDDARPETAPCATARAALLLCAAAAATCGLVPCSEGDDGPGAGTWATRSAGVEASVRLLELEPACDAPCAACESYPVARKVQRGLEPRMELGIEATKGGLTGYDV